MERLITNLDEHFQNKPALKEYPCVIIDGAGDEFSLVFDCLEEGDIPVIVNHSGTAYKLDKTVSGSPLNLKKILNVYPFTAAKSPAEQRRILNINDLMEVTPWMLCLS